MQHHKTAVLGHTVVPQIAHRPSQWVDFRRFPVDRRENRPFRPDSPAGGTAALCVNRLESLSAPPILRIATTSLAYAKTVYPRVCGGAVKLLVNVATWNRSIPACAGEPLPQSSIGVPTAVYPRVCGGASISISSRTDRRHAAACGYDLSKCH